MTNLNAVRSGIVRAKCAVAAATENYPIEVRVAAWAELLLLRSLEKGLDNVSNRPTMRPAPKTVKKLELVF
jgi:hypothetical protein